MARPCMHDSTTPKVSCKNRPATSCREFRRLVVRFPCLESGGVGPAIQDDVLSGDKSGVDAAEERAGMTKLAGGAEALGGNVRPGAFDGLLLADLGALGGG